ncbi:hypothetical protein Pmani_000332 [Petrolisthes manimaculis]|uniref:Uncharacterized protein n=1 Tax=Petrolisthes manimaculis TaxID=1843537 RepID=A0AAE1ULE3_9EUCA|nr:hypothetical protein Pmani_000332 [Petrolisthes manimaculis]
MTSPLAASKALRRSKKATTLSLERREYWSTRQWCVLLWGKKTKSNGERRSCSLHMRRISKIFSITLQKQEVREIGLNFAVPGLGMGIIVLLVQARGTQPSRRQRQLK